MKVRGCCTKVAQSQATKMRQKWSGLELVTILWTVSEASVL